MSDTTVSKATNPYDERIFSEIVELIASSRLRAVRAVNTALVDLYWQAGGIISRKSEGPNGGQRRRTGATTTSGQRGRARGNLTTSQL